ncbi:hypothetical protein [Acidithiobacillus sp.]|jgi:O-antigen/teichoic acid export membrane protein|uniref:lipopolysaccharide biosynthesis protein n=1 Tax=Acidithiobacillus sp. TaxID=1872118 RepID=UPI0025BC9415|nr:hypothetical protein [Acidithiobacillus sp.]MCK9187955.1 hypothetical protein [Acidithiobacillus sp.]MCK9359914.1 hypothetical protein [Acidithiobacillus sp.]
MDSAIIKRILHGLGANAYGQVVIVIIQLASVPILLHYWGVTLYGEWMILFAVPAYLSMTDLGFSLSAANDMTARMARGDTAGTLVVFQSLSALVYSVALAGLAISALLIATLPIQDWLHFTELPISDVRWVLWLLAAEVLIKLADGVNHAGFRANGEYPLHVGIYYTALLVQQSGVWLAAAFGHGLLVAAAWFFAVRVLVTPSVAVLLFHRHRSLKPGFAHARLTELRALAQPALANVAMPLAQALNIQGMVLVVGTALGPAAVVTFSVLRTLTRLALQMVLSVSHAVEPELARAWGAQDMSLLRGLYAHSLRAGFWLALIVAMALHFMGGWIVLLWTHGKVRIDTQLFDWLLLSAVASVFWYNGLNLLKAANRHLRPAVWYVISSLLAVMVAMLLLRTTGILSDAGLALLLMDALMTVYLLRQASALVRLPVAAMLGAMLDIRPYLKRLMTRSTHAL